MIKYFAKPGVSSMIAFNTETEDINTVEYMNTHIDWIYQIPADGVLQLEDGEKNVKKGDFVIKFYKRNEYTMHPVVVVKSTEWKSNIANEQKYNEKMREEAELKVNKKLNMANSCCDDCETCNVA